MNPSNDPGIVFRTSAAAADAVPGVGGILQSPWLAIAAIVVVAAMSSGIIYFSMMLAIRRIRREVSVALDSVDREPTFVEIKTTGVGRYEIPGSGAQALLAFRHREGPSALAAFAARIQEVHPETDAVVVNGSDPDEELVVVVVAEERTPVTSALKTMAIQNGMSVAERGVDPRAAKRIAERMAIRDAARSLPAFFGLSDAVYDEKEVVGMEVETIDLPDRSVAGKRVTLVWRLSARRDLPPR